MRPQRLMEAQAEGRTGHRIDAVRGRRRVLFLADHLGPPDGVHGVTTYLLDVLPALKAIGIEVGACFLGAPHSAAEALQAHGIPVRFLDTRSFDLLVTWRVAKLVRDESWDVLHCTQFRATVVGRTVARLLRSPAVVVQVHDLTMPPAYARLMNRIVARRADLGLCVSRAACDIAVRGYHLAPERLRVLYTGIDTRQFHPLSPQERRQIRLELDISPTAPVLCLAGRFYPVKGQAEMTRMMQHIVARRADCVLLLVGSGPGRTACEHLARELQLTDNILFLGHRDDVGRLLAAADAAVVPSSSEGLSRFAIEANLCGLPVVAYACGGVAEALADSRCGILVPPGDVPAFIAAVDRALAEHRSASDAEACARTARQRFGLAPHVQSLRECYADQV
jgi:glycosyltransferase involved in cell wall biosynthesis